MTHPLFTRALAVGALTVALGAGAPQAFAAGSAPAPGPGGAGSKLINTVTSTSSSNCVTGSETGCTTSVTVTAKPPTVSPGPYPAGGPVNGTGTPGDTITLTDGSGSTVCTATVQADGTWSCTPASPLGPGTVPLTPIDTTISPNVPGQSTDVVFEQVLAVPIASPYVAFGAAGALGVTGALVLVRIRRRKARAAELLRPNGLW